MKKINVYYLLTGILTVLLVLALWPSVPGFSSTNTKIAQIKARGVLRVSTITSPLTCYTVHHTAAGLDYELAKRFAAYLGVELQITVRRSIQDLFTDLQQGHADLLAAGLIYNQERASRFRAGPGYYAVSQQLVYHIDQKRPKIPADLKGRFMVAAGSSFLSKPKEGKNIHYRLPGQIISTRQGPKALLEAVAEGKLDYTIANSVTVSLLQRIHPQLAVAFDITHEKPVTWYMPQGDDDSLYAAILDFFNQLNETGVMARLAEKYFGHVGTFDYVDTRSFLQAIDHRLPAIQPLFVKYAGNLDWRLLAAMAWQESHWNPQATSSTGVRGMMMLTRSTAESLNVTNRLDPEQSIRGGSQYLNDLMSKIPAGITKEERIWFALAAYNMGFAHILDARKLTARQKGNPDSWADVKQRLPMLSRKRYYSQTAYGYARGHEAYDYVENIRQYQLSLVGYLQEQEKKRAIQTALQASGKRLSACRPRTRVSLVGQ